MTTRLHKLYYSQNIISMTPVKLIWSDHVAGMWEIGNAYKILVGIPAGKRPLEDLGVNNTILQWIFGN